MVALPALALQPADPAGSVLRGLQFGQQSRLFDLKRQEMQADRQLRERALGLREQELSAQMERAGLDEAKARVEFFKALSGDLARVDSPQAFEHVKRVYEPIMRRTGIDPSTITYDRLGEYRAFAEREAAQFGQPVAGIGPDGQPAFMRFDKSGGMQRVEGFQPLPRTGMEVQTPDGTIVRMGGEPGGSGLQKPTQNKVEEAYLNTTERMARVNRIRDSFRPEFLQIGNRWGNLATAWKEKAGFDASPQERQSLAEFSEFRSRAANDLNQTLKEMSGAAVTPQEAERLLKVIPNPGTGLFDGDSPTEFKAKMDDVFTDLRRAEARLNYIRRNGFDLSRMKDIPLDQVPRLINERAGQIELELGSQGITGEQLQIEVRRRLAEEFGLSQ